MAVVHLHSFAAEDPYPTGKYESQAAAEGAAGNAGTASGYLRFGGIYYIFEGEINRFVGCFPVLFLPLQSGTPIIQYLYGRAY